MVKKIILYALIWKAVIFMVAYVAQFMLPIRLTFTAIADHARFVPYWVWIWGNFDGDHYLKIAMRGYQDLEYTFFPLFPLLIRLFAHTFNVPHIIAGLLVVHLTFILSVYVLLKLLQIDGMKKYSLLFIATILFFPTSFFYGAVYNDSVFLLWTLLCIFFGRKKQWALATFFGILAMYTRFNGIGLFIYLLIEYLTSLLKLTGDNWKLSKLTTAFFRLFSFQSLWKSKIFIIACIPLALLTYLSYIHIVFGDWHKLFQTMDIWRQDLPVFPPQVFFRYFKIFLFLSPLHFEYWVAVTEYIFTCFYVVMLLWAWKKIRLSYWFFFFVSLVIPSMTGTFSGMPRYGLHIYPFFLVVTLFLLKQSRSSRIFYFTICSIFAIIMITLFTRGWFIS